jgi:hypothetical protein
MLRQRAAGEAALRLWHEAWARGWQQQHDGSAVRPLLASLCGSRLMGCLAAVSQSASSLGVHPQRALPAAPSTHALCGGSSRSCSACCWSLQPSLLPAAWPLSQHIRSQPSWAHAQLSNQGRSAGVVAAAHASYHHVAQQQQQQPGASPDKQQQQQQQRHSHAQPHGGAPSALGMSSYELAAERMSDREILATLAQHLWPKGEGACGQHEPVAWPKA